MSLGALITLTTDFGAGSGYPAQMKGVLLSALPDARIVDISHEVAHFDVLGAALLLEACVPWFPRDAVHVAVVDPGVGTARRALCVVDAEGRRLVGPDNGIFTPFLGAGARLYALADREVLPEPRSATFHGRDLFAPAAAFLARRGAPERLGPAVSDPVRLDWPEPTAGPGAVEGQVLAADPFGNLLTSIRASHLGPAGPAAVRRAMVDGRSARWVKTFGEGAAGELVAMLGSGGRVEIAVREGSAAAALGGIRGKPVRLELMP
jgi:S-adenosylmethionine hydrolase